MAQPKGIVLNKNDTFAATPVSGSALAAEHLGATRQQLPFPLADLVFEVNYTLNP
jgi:hypothetical protein